jgi:3-oxoacyl-[acyl-carrier protein] reductase
VAECAAFGVKAKAYASDASSFSQTEEVVNEIIKDFGTVDILINNAGV